MPKKIFPDFVPPMMAESAKAPFDSPDWIFEIKLDGYRAITVFDSAANRTSGRATAFHWKRNFRQTTVLGWRDDKKAQEVVLEQSSSKPV